MRRLVPLLSVLALSACKPTITEDPEPRPAPVPDRGEDPLVEQERVREAVRAYAAALSEREVEAATALVVADTFFFYEDLRLAALRSTRAQLESWDLMSVIMVLQIRSTVSRAELESYDGRGLFGRAVAEGLVGDEVESVSLDEVWIDDAGEAAQIRVEGTPIVLLRKEDREDGEEPRWRVDIPEMIRQIGPVFDAAARERVLAEGKARTAFTLLLLGTEDVFDPAILDGPLERIERSDGPN